MVVVILVRVLVVVVSVIVIPIVMLVVMLMVARWLWVRWFVAVAVGAAEETNQICASRQKIPGGMPDGR